MEWWLDNIDMSDCDTWNKCLLVLEGEEIIGCTTVNVHRLIIDGIEDRVFFRGNTIISENQRGKGVSKLLYNTVNYYGNWISVGITDIAWKIQPRYVNNFCPISSIHLYVSVNIRLFSSLINKSFGKRKKDCVFPAFMRISKCDEIRRVDDYNRVYVPESGRWTADRIEVVRDHAFFQMRYVNIYCADRYGFYEYYSAGRHIGYFVVRRAVYKGIDMISLVDYRILSMKDEFKAFKAASKIARYNRIGFVLAMSSRRYKFSLSPLTVRMNKELNCAIGMKDKWTESDSMLITSADSDLDFVYYK